MIPDVAAGEYIKVYYVATKEGFEDIYGGSLISNGSISYEYLEFVEIEEEVVPVSLCFDRHEPCEIRNRIWQIYGIDVEDAELGQLIRLKEVLDMLPSVFVESLFCDKVRFDASTSFAGLYDQIEGDIVIDDDVKQKMYDLLSWQPMEEVFVHELTHAYQWGYMSLPRSGSNDWALVYDNEPMKSWNEITGWEMGVSGWKNNDLESSPTEYGKTNPVEDMAESVLYYVYHNEKLREASSDRYDYIKDNVFNGWEP